MTAKGNRMVILDDMRKEGRRFSRTWPQPGSCTHDNGAQAAPRLKFDAGRQQLWRQLNRIDPEQVPRGRGGLIQAGAAENFQAVLAQDSATEQSHPEDPD